MSQSLTSKIASSIDGLSRIELNQSAGVELLIVQPLLDGTVACYTLNAPRDAGGNKLDDFIRLSKAYIADETFNWPVKSVVTTAEVPLTGALWQGSGVNHYTNVPGAYFNHAFEGTGATFRHYATNDGGIWHFVAKNANDEIIADCTLSTWAESPVTNKPQVVFEKLPYAAYTITGTFLGQDPEHPAASPRGWARSDRILEIIDNPVSQGINPIVHTIAAGVQEFAWSMRPVVGSTGTLWVPEHNQTGTAFYRSPSVLKINGQIVNLSSVQTIADVESVELQQFLYGRTPQIIGGVVSDVNLLEIDTTHTWRGGVLSISGQMRGIVDSEMSDGFTAMLTLTNTAMTKGYTDDGVELSTYLAELGDDVPLPNATQALFTNATAEHGIAVRANEWRLPNRPEYDIFLRRDASVKKWYPRISSVDPRALITAGYEYSFSGEYSVGMNLEISWAATGPNFFSDATAWRGSVAPGVGHVKVFDATGDGDCIIDTSNLGDAWKFRNYAGTLIVDESYDSDTIDLSDVTVDGSFRFASAKTTDVTLILPDDVLLNGDLKFEVRSTGNILLQTQTGGVPKFVLVGGNAQVIDAGGVDHVAGLSAAKESDNVSVIGGMFVLTADSLIEGDLINYGSLDVPDGLLIQVHHYIDTPTGLLSGPGTLKTMGIGHRE